MKRRYMYIILGILLIGLTGFLLFQEPEQPESPLENKDIDKKEKESTDAANEEPAKNEQEETNEKTEPEQSASTPSFQEAVSEVVQNTKDFFTHKETYVTAVGDSLTQGVGDTKVEGGYVGILDDLINKNNQLVVFENYGKRGNRSNQLLKRLEKPEIASSIEESDIVLITIGANDIMKVLKENFTNLTFKEFAQERVDYEKRLKSILDRITALNPDAKIYLIGFYNPFEKYFKDIKELGIIVENWNRTGESVTNEYDNATFIPTVDLFKNKDETFFAEDNFHPSHQGYQLMAKRVLEYITD